MRDANDKAFAKGTGDRDELVNHTHSGVIITRRDIKSVASRQWLNDEVMNVYMGLLQVCSLRIYTLFIMHSVNDFIGMQNDSRGIRTLQGVE